MKHFLTYFFILFFYSLSAQDSLFYLPIDTQIVNTSNTSKIDEIINTALGYKGVKYSMGGMGYSGMDCSGLVCTAFKNVDINLPHSSGSIADLGKYVEADYLQKGDLIFFQGRTSSSVGHVAIVSKIVDGLIYIVHATTSKGVIEEILQNNTYFMSRWLFNKRIEE
jgi:cell wall-associated NlpC family hydrolase